MKTISALLLATIGLTCESPYLSLLCLAVVLVLIIKSK